MENKKLYMIIPLSSASKVDFSTVEQNNIDDLEIIHFGEKTYVSWYGMTPIGIENIQKSEGPFNEEIFSSVLKEQNTEHTQSLE